MDEELIWMAVSALLSVMALSYILGDNVFFRLALHIFVGASAAYAVVVAVHAVIIPALYFESEQQSAATLLMQIGTLLGLLLLIGGMVPHLPGLAVKKLAVLGQLPLVVLLGVGLAVGLAGALLGTLGPQILATIEPLGQADDSSKKFVEGIFVLVGTTSTLLVFNFRSQPGSRKLSAQVLHFARRVGRGFLLIGLGAAFGGTLIASLSLFADRVRFLIDVTTKLLEG